MRHHLCGMLVLVFGLCGGAELQAADSPEKQAETLLQQAQTACEAGRDPEAEKLFRTVLEKFAQTPSAQSARFGFGWVLTRSSTARLPQAIENLTPPANDGNFPQRGWALYLLAVCHRREALAELDKPAANPTAWEQQKKAAEPKLQEALRRFHEARDWFAAKQQDGWSGRARCDEAEILLRLNRHRDVRSVCEPFAKDEKFTTNPHRAMGLYYHGFACFLDGGYDEASQSLHQVAPFDQPGFGLHAEYLVGRLLHRADENEAASVHYEAVLTGFQKQRTAALAARKEPPFQNLPAAEQARLTALATHAPPDYVAAAALHLARLKQESGRYAEALGLFESWCADYPQSPLMPDAMLHRGACLVQGERDADAEKLLEPLLTSTPRLADQAQFWLSLARFHLACLIDTTRKSERDGKINAALEALRQSADRANQLTATDPEAKPRRHEMLFCYADALEKAERFRDAGQTFEQLWNEQAMPARRDLILQRMVVAYGRANDNRSEPRGEEFFREFRDSVFLPIVSYRLAANAWNRAQEIAVRHDRNQTEELEKRLHEAADKFAAVATKFPESVPANQARLAAGICQALVDQFDRANTILSQISAADRSGELAVADYLQGDCLIQMSPREPVDRAEMMQARDHLTHAEQLLTRFHNSARASPYQAAAWLALGECRARLAALTTDATRRATDREAARSAWEQLLRIAPQDRLAGYAEIALAKLRAVQGDRAGAIQELRLYQNGAKQSHFVAPLAVMQLAVQLQEEGEIAESEKILANARTQWEGVLAKDPERIDWVHLLRFHHALALRGLSRGNEARPLFDRVYSEARGLPVSVASARQAVLCSLDQAHAKQITGTAAFSSARNPNERQAATRAIHEARNEIHRAGEELQNRAAQLRSAFPDAIMRARMFYDAAWCFRDLMEAEVQESWEQLRQQVARQEAEELLRFLPPRTRLPAWPLPQVSRQDLPLQPSERRAQAAYQSLIDEFPIEAIGVAARLELAELQVLRADPAAAVPLLQAAREALTPTHPVPARLREQVHMRLGGCLMGLGQYDSAFRQYHTVVHDPESYDTVLARMYASECLIHMGKPAEAAELLAPARTVARGVLAEAVLLRHAQAQLQAFQWREADLGFEQFLAQCGNEHPFAWAARYGRACVDQNQQRFAEARAGYRPIVEHAVGPLAAQAQIRLGQCWLAEGKAAEAIAELLVAATRQPDSAEAHVAVLEAARACLTAEKPQQAELLLTRLLADVPVASDWARAARERLDLLVRE